MWESETSIHSHLFTTKITTKVSSVKWVDIHKVVTIYVNTYWESF